MIKKHSCKQLKRFIKEIGISMSIERIEDTPEYTGGWVLNTDDGHLYDVWYCCYCGKQLNEQNT